MDNGRTAAPSKRPTVLRRYMRALEEGDVDTMAAIVHLAEIDAALERMLLAANEAYFDPQDVAPGDEVSLATAARFASIEPAISPQGGRVQRGTPSRRQLALGPGWLSTMAAMAVLVALLGSFFVLFVSRDALGPNGGQPTQAATTATSVPIPTGTALPPELDSIIAGTQQGRLIALRVSSGAVIWNQTYAPLDTIVRSADTVYVAEHPGPKDFASIFAYRASDGTRLWKVTNLPLEGYTYMALDGGTLVVDSNYGNGTVYGLDADTGTVRWSQPADSGLRGRLITATDGVAYIISLKGFNAYDVSSGKLLWSYIDVGRPATTLGNNGPSVVAGSGRMVYYSIFDLVSQLSANLPVLVAFDDATGAVRQRLTAAQIGRPLLVTSDGTVYTAKENQLCAFRIVDGKQLWCNSSFDGTEYSLRLVRTSTALLYSRIENDQPEAGALGIANGRQIWSWHGAANLYDASNSMSLAGDKNTLYLATRDGMYAFRVSAGTVLWHALASTNLSFIQPALPD